jgi:hypothetical protein
VSEPKKPIDIDSIPEDVRAAVEADLLARGYVPPEKDKESVGARLDRAFVIAKQCERAGPGNADPQQVAEASRLFDGACQEMLGITGPAPAASPNAFRPEPRVTEAAADLKRAKEELPGPCYNVTLQPEVPRLIRVTKGRTLLLNVHLGSAARIQGHLLGDRGKLHEWVVTNYPHIGPMFSRDVDMQQRYPDLYGYMTDRARKGAQTRKENEAREDAWTAKRSSEMEAAAEKKARARMAEDLTEAFLRHIEETEGSEKK